MRASVSSTGVSGNGYSGWPAISGNGRYVAFASEASNLVSNDTNGVQDVFVHDLLTGATTRVSVGPGGIEGDWVSGSEIAISHDGNHVSFESFATNLVSQDTNAEADIFVHDRITHTTVRVSVRSDSAQGDRYSSGPNSISADGRIVAFQSYATNLVAGDTNVEFDVFVHDLTTHETSRVSVSSAGAQSLKSAFHPALSADARYVAFDSQASNLAPGGPFDVYNVFVHDRLTAQTVRVTNIAGDFPSNCDSASLSSDGGRIAYAYKGTLFNDDRQVVVKDLLTGVITGASREPVLNFPQAGNDDSYEPSLASNVAIVAFYSEATNLIAADTSGSLDVFVTDLFAFSPTIASYCTAGTTTHGCTPTISGVIIPRANASSSFTLVVTGVEGDKAGLIFYGAGGAQAVPFGSGVSTLCIASPLQRTPVMSSGGTSGMCDGVLSLDWNQFRSTHPEALSLQPLAGRRCALKAGSATPSLRAAATSRMRSGSRSAIDRGSRAARRATRPASPSGIARGNPAPRKRSRLLDRHGNLRTGIRTISAATNSTTAELGTRLVELRAHGASSICASDAVIARRSGQEQDEHVARAGCRRACRFRSVRGGRRPGTGCRERFTPSIRAPASSSVRESVLSSCTREHATNFGHLVARSHGTKTA